LWGGEKTRGTREVGPAPAGHIQKEKRGGGGVVAKVEEEKEKEFTQYLGWFASNSGAKKCKLG